MHLRLPVTGLLLKYKTKHIRALVEELAAKDRELNDLWKDPFLSAVRLIQVGRAWEEKVSIEDAEEIIDQEKEGGVDFNELTSAMAQAFWGKRVRPLKVHPELPDEEEAPAADDDGTTPKKSDLTAVAPLGRVS